MKISIFYRIFGYLMGIFKLSLIHGAFAHWIFHLITSDFSSTGQKYVLQNYVSHWNFFFFFTGFVEVFEAYLGTLILLVPRGGRGLSLSKFSWNNIIFELCFPKFDTLQIFSWSKLRLFTFLGFSFSIFKYITDK